MTTADDGPVQSHHPWLRIDLDAYERHMADPQVGQLQRLRDIMREQLSAYPARRIGVLGIAGGNGLGLVDPDAVDAVYGYDINPDYLEACASRYRDTLANRLHVIEARLDRSLAIQPVDLLLADLIIEYIGVDEFVAFAKANDSSIGVLSCVVQRNDRKGFVSTTRYESSFEGLASVSSEIDPGTLSCTMSAAGFVNSYSQEYPLPNGKALVRQDFVISSPTPSGGATEVERPASR